MKPVSQITDRAKRYRAQGAVRGEKRCVLCGARGRLDVMHLDGNESNGEAANLAYGCRSCNGKLAHAFKRIGAGVPTRQYNPGKGGTPTFQQYAFAVSNHTRGAHDEGGAIIHATPKHKRIEYARRIAGLKSDKRWNPIPAAVVAAGNDYLGYQVTSAVAGKGLQLGSKLMKKGTRGLKRNPAQLAAEVSEEFHGRPVKELVTVKEKVHHHAHLAELGKLRKLVVLGVDGYRHSINGFGGALLCSNEEKNQLFIVGGDQTIDLSDFGIEDPHEVETLGQVQVIDYFTSKEHLGDEGGTAVYRHKFRTTNEDGRHVTVRMARYPELIYFKRDKRLGFSGGSYTIRAEGVDL